MTPSDRSTDVAILGLGPAGIRAVERLVHWGHRTPSARLHIVCYDPAPPGGAAFAPDLPDHLRTDADSLDAWYREGAAPAQSRQPSFEQWRPTFSATYDRAPLRREVGLYYEAVWAHLHRLLPVGWSLEHMREPATTVTREIGWRVDGRLFDEVLVTDAGSGPVAEPALDEDAVPAGSAVVIGDAGRRFVDAALTLTQGRGGTFTPGRRAHRMVYRRSGRDVAVLYPVDPSRRFAHVRPSADHVPAVHAVNHRTAPVLTEVASVVDVLLDAAAQHLFAAEVAEQREALDAVTAALARLEAGVPATGDPRTLLEESIRIAFGDLPITAETALGLAWRWLCPAVHDMARDDALAPEHRARLAQLSDALAPLTAGPAPIDGVKLLALIDAGVVDPRSLQGPRLGPDGLEWPATAPLPRPNIDLVLPLPAPGVGFDAVTGGLASSLRTAGVRVAQGRRGVAIGADAVCSGLPGLACVGTITKEFSPCVHSQGSDRLLDRWAEGVLVRAGAWLAADAPEAPTGAPESPARQSGV